jgi:hypothetical protein
MLSTGGQVKILDFGLALLRGIQIEESTDAAWGGHDLTHAGQIVGTFDYMAPEQGTDSHEVDTKADVYSLGATLYKLLSGQSPVASAEYSTPEKKLEAVASQAIPDVRELRSEVPEDLANLLERLLKRDVEQRIASAKEVAQSLEPYVRGSNLVRLLKRARVATDSGVETGSFVTTSTSNDAATPGYSRQRAASGRSRSRFKLKHGVIAIFAATLCIAAVVIYFKLTVKVVSDPVPKHGRPCFEADFALGVPERWRVARGDWTVSDGALNVYMAEKYYPGFVFAPNTSWRDYAVECEMRCGQSVAGIVFRHDHKDRFYALTFRREERSGEFHDHPEVVFEKYIPMQDEAVSPETVYGCLLLAQKEYEFSAGEYYRIRVEVEGTEMRCFVGDEWLLSARDKGKPIFAVKKEAVRNSEREIELAKVHGMQIHNGSIGFLAGDSCNKPGIASFRNLRVESYDGNEFGVWEFEEGEGERVEDSSGNGNTGILHGDFRWTAGRDGTAVTLNGTNSFVSIPDSPSQSGMPALTIHVLFQLHSRPKAEVGLVRKWGSQIDAWATDDDSFNLEINRFSQLGFCAQNGSNLTRDRAYSEPLPLDKWIEIVAVYDGIRNTIYTHVEGELWKSEQGPELPSKEQRFNIRDTDEPIEIGCDPKHEIFLNATIHWIRISGEAWKPG